jgi:molecular chaperone HscB
MQSDAALCRGCGKSAAGQLVCGGCGVVQELPRDADFFALFGLDRRLTIDLDDLERRFYALSRNLHPDVLHDRSPAEQAEGLRATALVTRAYRTLRDPVQRGLYWLSLHGESLGRDNERVPPALAAMVFAVQEKLEELRAARLAGDGTPVAREIEEIRRDLAVRRDDVDARLAGNVARTDQAGVGTDTLVETKAILSELHYLRTLARDVDKELEAGWTAS